MGSIDTKLGRIETLLRLTQEIGRINSLEALQDSQRHRKTISELWAAIQADLDPISQAIKALPSLPDLKTIQWARTTLAHRDLLFMEIDTTGTDPLVDEIVRFTVVDASEGVVEDFYIKPTKAQLSQEAGQHNGITPEMLETHGIGIIEAWERIQAALSGNYIISYSQQWDMGMLEAMAARHQLEPLVFLGEDLQRRCTTYYNGEYYLSLAKLAERVGYPLPELPGQTAIHRAIAQHRITEAIANAVTDVRPPRVKEPEPASTDSTEEDYGLGSLEDHPF
jgi:hypothetical protein